MNPLFPIAMLCGLAGLALPMLFTLLGKRP